MNKDLLVEIFVPTQGDEGLIATGYPVAKDRILTAAHVLDDATDPNAIEVRWYNQEGPAREWRNINEIVCGGEDLDAALLDCTFPEGIYPGGSLSARRPRDDMRWISEGFLRAGKVGDNRDPISLQGGVHSKGSHSPWFEVGVDYPPGKAQDFQGASGSPVFVKGSIIGIIQSCPQNFQGRRLRVTSVWFLLEEEDFCEDVRRDTPALGAVAKSLQKLISGSHQVMEALSDKLDIPEHGTEQEWADEIARTVINLPCSDLIEVLDGLHRDYCREGVREIAETCIQLLNTALPATYDLKTVAAAIERIQAGEVFLADLPIMNETCAEIIMAGVDGLRSMEIENVQDAYRFPPGTLRLPDPPETGMDPQRKEFQRAWEDLIIERFISPEDWQLFHSDQKLARDTVIARVAKELAYRASYLKCTSYYVFRHTMGRDAQSSWCDALEKVKNEFPALVFICLCKETEVPDHVGYTFHILRDMYKRHNAIPKE